MDNSKSDGKVARDNIERYRTTKSVSYRQQNRYGMYTLYYQNQDVTGSAFRNSPTLSFAYRSTLLPKCRRRRSATTSK